MILSIMAYGFVLGLLLSGGALFVDRGLRSMGLPTRWVWLAAMAGIGFLPVASLLNPSPAEPEPTLGAVIPMDALYRIWEGTAASTDGTWDLLWGGIDPPLGLLWFGTSLLVILLFSGGTLRLHRQSRSWPSARVRGQDLLISDGLGPAVVGLLRPNIVLPHWALSLEKEEMEMILFHEVEHRRVKDPAVLALGIVLLALAPWNPGLWWCLRRLHLAVEGDCDGRVLARGIPAQKYGRLLLGVASGTQGLFPLVPALAERDGTFLERRLLMMKNHVGKKRMGRALGAMAVGGIFLALACETPTPPTPAVETEVGPGGEVTAGTVTLEAEEGEILKEGLALKDGVRIRLEEAPKGVQQTVEAAPLIYVDGVRIEDGVAKTVISELNPDLIDRIEVIKGAAAEAIFGPEAADGVIQIFLKK